MTGREVLGELTRIAQADWQNFLRVQYGDDGEVIAAKVHLKDKVKALELLGKYHQPAIYTRQQTLGTKGRTLQHSRFFERLHS